MKTKLVLTVLSILAIAGVSEAACDSGAQSVIKCISTPQAGDHEVAIAMVQKIDICKMGDKTFIALEADGSSASEPTSPTVRVGATTYPIGDLGNLSIGTTPSPKGGRYAKFNMNMNNGSGDVLSATFACK